MNGIKGYISIREASYRWPERAGRRQHPGGHRHPQQPDRLGLLGSPQRVFLGPDGLRHLRLQFPVQKSRLCHHPAHHDHAHAGVGSGLFAAHH